MIFFFVAVVFMYIGRKVGWSLSKRILMRAHIPSIFIFSIAWGAVVAVLMYAII